MQKQFRIALLSLLAAGAATLPAAAQGVPVSSNFFGVNYWYSQPNATITADLNNANMKIYRLGGEELNRNTSTSRDWSVKENWLPSVNYIKNSLNGEPLVQLSINLTDAQVTTWVNYFTSNGVSYFAIGNEADPSPDQMSLTDWVTNNKPYLGLSYYGFRDRFKAIARLVKQANNNCKIIGGDFRLFYDQPISLYYSNFISDVGDEYVTVGTRKIPLLDTFSFHYYDSQGNREQVLTSRFDAIQGYLDNVNTTRHNIDATWTDLRMAVTEVNTEANGTSVWKPYSFTAGQFVATMTKLALAKRAFCVTPWSIFEHDGDHGATDFSLYNPDNSRRSTMHHFALLSQNKRANYMPGDQETNASYSKDDLVFLGMRDATGYTVLLMNNSGTSRTYSISLDNTYRGTASARIKLEGYTGVSTDLRTGTISGHMSILYRLTAAGTYEAKTYYDDNDAAPVLQRPTALAATAGPATAAVALYPNPTTGSFALDGLAGPVEVVLRSLTGQQVLRQQQAATTPVDISRLAAGTYMLTVTTGAGEVLRQKVTKQ
ncbi:T9SS type A sorting domain-containing protein [Hymenobacter negativus]|uniref:T9SS type A sorting domain-containing protein n=1 Tax=Hymenobacter negativus TaxID=2795026 RepID=A0ABS3QMM6_9BACT|nr:T9SS type A sorting domain-containing protein [Hymenobacter negativus]MBO2012273.1 T9SS type A sorting domain-containing protein [Hymenobacter negativus]